LHAVADAQAKCPGHGAAGIDAHAPVPLQLAAGVSRPALQAAATHDVEGRASRHPPLPSQAPSWPHVAPPWVHLPPDDPPAMTGKQAPFFEPLVLMVHDMHAAVHAVLQQKPLTQ
jgi:hypothetical protein